MGKWGCQKGRNTGKRKHRDQMAYLPCILFGSRQRQLGMEGVKWREKREKYKNTGRESNPFLNTTVMAAERASLVTIIPGKTVYGK